MHEISADSALRGPSAVAYFSPKILLVKRATPMWVAGEQKLLERAR